MANDYSRSSQGKSPDLQTLTSLLAHHQKNIVESAVQRHWQHHRLIRVSTNLSPLKRSPERN